MEMIFPRTELLEQKLPSDPKKGLILSQLFGDQALLSFPSERRGMQYCMLSLQKK